MCAWGATPSHYDCEHGESMDHIFLKKGTPRCCITHPTQKTCFDQYHPHQVHWSDQEICTAISCTKAGQVTSRSQLLDKFSEASQLASA